MMLISAIESFPETTPPQKLNNRAIYNNRTIYNFHHHQYSGQKWRFGDVANDEIDKNKNEIDEKNQKNKSCDMMQAEKRLLLKKIT